MHLIYTVNRSVRMIINYKACEFEKIFNLGSMIYCNLIFFKNNSSLSLNTKRINFDTYLN